ncbi:Malonyl CoA-acyl carrier protein transacylase [Actinokineospora spheciospongiae]|uniref:[acyl-carrier-protein] S-malonyltransferase n=1 Tax=Actinokineospora spheciospongiae TaxID=909613 RepID=W7IY68_9PSEU|nr:ACP S-malonyltransferase [Actinokineospora spheciospongiae]EWC61441.1 Malonyl CoA-acyl carrier protein transacylase [Actinokineospora spheciospongiae]
MIALLAPGQGSQAPGMLLPWLELPDTAERLAGWSEVAGLDLARLGTTADADEIKDTAITQPLIVASTLLAHEELARRVEIPADVLVAGHSIGEFAAAAIAGVLTPEDAVALAAVRGREMAAACELEPTGMSALVRGTEEGILARLAELGLVPANRNGAGQIVAAGSTAALEKLAAEPPEGAKAITLKVAGAFHTRYMAPAQDALRAHAATLATPADPTRTLLSNRDGAVVTDGADVLERLIDQVTNPVRWDLCMATMAERGVTAVVEFPPAGALVGLAKRELKGTPFFALKTPDTLDAVVELIGSTS